MAAVAEPEIMIDGSALLAIVEEWLSRGRRLYSDLCASDARLVCALRAGERREVGLDTADRLLVTIGMEYRLAELAPPPRVSRRSRRSS